MIRSMTREREGPGQFAFGDRDKVFRLFDESGWQEARVEPLNVLCTLPKSELIHHFTRLGAVGRTLGTVDDKLREHLIKTIRAAFEPFVHGTEVKFTAACWMASARRRPN